MGLKIENIEARSHRELDKSEGLRRVLAWSEYTPELAMLVGRPSGARKSVIAPLPQDEWINHLSEFARVRADNQHQEGLDAGYFPPSYILNTGVYTNDPLKVQEQRRQGQRLNIRKYNPTIVPKITDSIKTYFPRGPRIVDYCDIAYSLVKKPYILPGDIEPKGDPAADAFAEEYFEIFTQSADVVEKELRYSESKGRITARDFFGHPVIFCEKREDVLRLKPYTWSQLDFPDNVQAFSFVVNKKRSIPFTNQEGRYKGSTRDLNGTLWVICHESCPHKVVKQHLRSQVLWKASAKTDLPSPVLITKYPVDLADAVDNKVKEYALELLVREQIPRPVNWGPSATKAQRINSALETIFNEGKPLSLTKWVSPRRKDILVTRRMMSERMCEAFEVINDFTNVGAAGIKEWQLIIASMLSLFPPSYWKEVKQLAGDWDSGKGLSRFRRGLGFPRQNPHDL